MLTHIEIQKVIKERLEYLYKTEPEDTAEYRGLLKCLKILEREINPQIEEIISV